MIATGNWGTCEWKINESGELVIGGGKAESVSADGKYPWDEYRDRIRKVSFEGEVIGVVSMIGIFMNCTQLEEVDLTGLDTSTTVDMSWMFCGCEKLEEIDISMLDTGKVVDMSCMFLSCRSLKHVELGSIDTSSVMDMSRMFMYCSNLKTLDVSGLDNHKVDMAEDMFVGCRSLRAVVPGRKFSMTGSGKTMIQLPESDSDTEMVSDWRTSRDGVLYIADTDFTVRYDGSGAETTENAEPEKLRILCRSGECLRAIRNPFVIPQGRVFKEWNTAKDGKGRTIQPGQFFDIHSDMTLHAIWAGVPAFKRVFDIPEITYGQLLEMEPPEVVSNHGDITSLKAQISGITETDWSDFSNEEPLTVSRSGAKIRYVAENYVGTTVSEEREISIRKASYDMSGMKWKLPEDLSYDGAEKTVFLEGLPEGITAEYAGAKATEVGQYTARAILHYDEENYEPPQAPDDLPWAITRGKYKMPDLGWSYLEAFTYDGQTKSVRLSGLPEGTTPYYDGADAVNAGTYIATAGLDYDINNYDNPDPIKPCMWQILKTTHDMSGVRWEGTDAFVYDGTPKKVELTGLPEGVRAEYTGNMAVDSGYYTARAVFMLDDPVNYEIPEPLEFKWQIRKADHDMSGLSWTDDRPVYDGSEKQISLNGIPDGVSVIYEGDRAVESGMYMVKAEFCVEDLKNYNQVEPITRAWEIRKAPIDTSKTRWNYSSPYVYNDTEKTVCLQNIPPQVEVSYEGNAAVNAGHYTARAICEYDDSNYLPPEIPDCSWEILKANLKLQDLQWDYDEAFVYDGQEHGVSIANLPDNAQVSYENNRAVNAGHYVAKAFITPKDPDNFFTPPAKVFSWDIRKAVFDISGIVWDIDEKRIFDGQDKSVSIRNLPQGVRAFYQGNAAQTAGSYKAKAVFDVVDSDNFLPPEPQEIEWKIDPARLDLRGITWDYRGPFTYDGSEKKILLKGLPEGVRAEYTGNVASEAGEYAAQAVLIPPEDSSFKETSILGQVWRIDRADIDVSGARWEYDGNFVYDGLPKQISMSGLPDSVRTDYICCEAVDAGEYRAEAILTPYDTDNYNTPFVPGCTWQIAKADIDISAAEWSGYETFVYDGTAHRVILNGLPETVEAIYQGNTAVDAGNYIASADFRPLDEKNYNPPGRRQYDWSVAKAQVQAPDVHWETGGEIVYDGQEHTVTLQGLPEGVYAEYKGNTAVDAGQYIASAVLQPEDTVNFMPKVCEPFRWEIEKAEIDVSDVMWASSGELVYDGTIKVIGLTGLSDDVSVEYENNVATDAGTYHASAVLSIESSNYTAPEIEGCEWTIKKAVPDISGIAWNYVIDFTYDGYEKSVELMDLPDGMSAVYTGNAAIEAGEYVAEAKLVMADPVNYEAPQVPPLEWKIGKRDYDLSQAFWEGAEGFVYDGTAKSVELTGLEEGLEPIYQDNVAVDAGVYTATARFLYDEDNYNPPEELSCTWEIRKAPLDTSEVSWNYDGPFKASGKTRQVTLTTTDPQPGFVGRMFSKNKPQNYKGLPEGTTVRYEGNTAKAPGTYEAKAYLNVPPQPNHEVTEPICLTWEIRND